MTEIVGGNLEVVTFHLVRPNGFTEDEAIALNEVTRESLADDYSEYSEFEREILVQQASKRRRTSNGGKITPIDEKDARGGEYL